MHFGWARYFCLLLTIYKDGLYTPKAEAAILEELNRLKTNLVNSDELQKVKNKVESLIAFTEMRIQERALNLAYAEHLGDINMVNTDIERYRAVTPDKIRTLANQILKPENCSTLYYLAKK